MAFLLSQVTDDRDAFGRTVLSSRARLDCSRRSTGARLATFELGSALSYHLLLCASESTTAAIPGSSLFELGVSPQGPPLRFAADSTFIPQMTLALKVTQLGGVQSIPLFTYKIMAEQLAREAAATSLQEEEDTLLSVAAEVSRFELYLQDPG